MQLTKVNMPTSKYSIKCPYTMTPDRIVVHNTYNDASAMSEISYMMGNNNLVSFHYAVDDYRVVQGIEENRNAWHAGDGHGNGNRKGIAIEICYSKSGGDRFTKAEDNAVELVVSILKRYGWGIDKVTKHQDYSGKYCPHRTLDLGWERFINKVKAKLNGSTAQNTSEQSVTPYLVKINSDDGFLNVRDGAGMNYKVNTTVKNGEVFTIVAKNGDWGKLKSGAGYIYLPLTKAVNKTTSTSTTKTKTTTGSVYLRSTAAYGNNIICVIPKGKKVTYHSGTGWAKVTYNGKTGYCGYKYLK